MSDLKLYQFPISHYCEKVRWALDLKGLHYQTQNLLPGFHIKVIRQFSKSTAVPLLKHGDHAIQGSAEILDYLDTIKVDTCYTPVDATLAREWESRLDSELGPATRVFAYYYLLDQPKIIVPWLSTGLPFFSRWLFRLLFPKIAQVMRKKMRINDETANASRAVIEHLLTEVAQIYRTEKYLAGEHFSRADIAACSLLAPLFMPQEYGIHWGTINNFPIEFKQWIEDHQSDLSVVATVYQKNRKVNLCRQNVLKDA